MGKLGYLTKEGFRNLKVNKLMSVASVTVLFSCLMLIGIAFMLLVNIEAFIGGIEAENVIMVYADLDSTEVDYISLGNRLESIDNVAFIEKVEKEQAYAEILSELDEGLKSYLSDINENPLPDAYRVTVADMTGFDAVVSEIKTLGGIERVYENSSLARQLSGIRNSVTYISAGMIALLLIVSLFIISNTIKVTMFSRRLEISIMKSVGATNSFIRWPFMVEGIIIGIIAGLLATGAVWAIYEFALGSFTSVLSGFGGEVQISFLDYALYLVAAFVGIGIFTGIFGSATSIRKYLKERKFVELEE
ncbi:MAG: permease-like cell division protein FtsX [Clostridia bacterium]|nr:permease-like cell division protein FtsX [Clostridia bacterium]MBQ2694037.1 permease-like cell division protein FtsX [Clostridia bacterium]